jgi:hypothetical protein
MVKIFSNHIILILISIHKINFLASMIQQFLTIEYGSKKKLKRKLDEYFGSGNYEVVEVRKPTPSSLLKY